MMCRRKNPEDTNLQQGLEQAEAKMNVGGYTHAAAPGKAIGEPQPEPEPSALSVGGKVTVQGLKGAPQHNGKSGSCLSWNDAKGRYNVELESGEIVGIRPANLAPYTAGGTCWAGGEWRREDDGGRFWADGAWQRWAKDPAPLCDVGGELLGYESDESDGGMEDDTP